MTTVSLVSVTVAYLVWTSSAELAGFGGDNAMYMLAARHYAWWLPDSPTATFFAEATLYPPIFPWLLAAVGGAENVRIAHGLVAVTLSSSVALMMLWLHRASQPPCLVMALPVVFALLPSTLLQSIYVHSEFPYLVFSLIALGLLTARDRERLALPSLVLLTAVLAMALMTRTAGIALFLAVLLHLGRSQRYARSFVVVAAAVPAVAWELSVDRAGLGYVADWLLREGPLHSLSWARATGVYMDLLRHVVRDMLFAGSPGLGWLAAVVGVLAVIGAALRAWRGHVDGIYSLVYLAMVLTWGVVWPGELSRNLLPLLPFALFHVHWVLRVGVMTVAVRAGSWVDSALVVIWCMGAVPGTLSIIERYRVPVPPGLEEYAQAAARYQGDPEYANLLLAQHAALVDVFKGVRDWVPDTECVYSSKPSIVTYYSSRLSQKFPERFLDEAEFKRFFEEGGCPYTLSVAFPSPSFPTPFYPLGRLGSRVVEETRWYQPGTEQPLAILARLR